MSAPSSEDRIRELVRDLRPVRPIPPLRSEVAVVAGTGLAVVCLAWRMGAFLPRARLDPAWLDARFLVILFGLALAFVIETRNPCFHVEKELSQSFKLPLVLGIPLLLTPAEENARTWKRGFEWLVISIMALGVFAAEFYISRRG